MTKRLSVVILALVLGVSALYAGKGKVRIASDKEGAYIYVDGEKKAMTGEGFTSILLEEGEHIIKVLKPDNEYYVYSAQKKVYVGKDTSMKITLKLNSELKESLKAKYEAELATYKRAIPQRDVVKRKRWIRQGNMVIDTKLGLMWQDNNAAKSIKKKWKVAKEYCQNLSFGKYNDWRMPSYDELISIIDYDRYEPAIMPSFKSTAFGSYREVYWSNSKYEGGKDVLGVYFTGGHSASLYKSDKHHIRCIRNK